MCLPLQGWVRVLLFVFFISENINLVHARGCSPWRSEGSPAVVGAGRGSPSRHGEGGTPRHWMHSGDPQPTPQRPAKTHRSLSSTSPEAPRNSWVIAVCHQGGVAGPGLTEVEGAMGRATGGARGAVTEHRPPRGDARPPEIPAAAPWGWCEDERQRGGVTRTAHSYSGCHSAGSCSEEPGKAEGLGWGGSGFKVTLCGTDPQPPLRAAQGAAVPCRAEPCHPLRRKRCHELRRGTRSGRRARVQPRRGGPVFPRDAHSTDGEDAERYACTPARFRCSPQTAAWDCWDFLSRCESGGQGGITPSCFWGLFPRLSRWGLSAPPHAEIFQRREGTGSALTINSRSMLKMQWHLSLEGLGFVCGANWFLFRLIPLKTWTDLMVLTPELYAIEIISVIKTH